MSDNFRDLERPDAAHRKEQVLMAAISGLECLEHPTRQDLVRFSRLFMPLYAGAHPDVRRTASAALSRLPRLPDDVADMLVNEPIAIAAPFIAHYPLLKESTLARAVARRGAPHARAAARRSDLSPQAIATLRSLNDPSVEGLLILRGLIPDPARVAAAAAVPDSAAARAQPRRPAAAPARSRTAPPAAPEASPQAAPAAPAPHTAPRPAPGDVTRPLVAAPPLDPSGKLREALRALALRAPSASAPLKPAQDAARARPGTASRPDPLDVLMTGFLPAPEAPATGHADQALRRWRRPAPTVGVRAPAQPLNRPLSARAGLGAPPAPRATPAEGVPPAAPAAPASRLRATPAPAAAAMPAAATGSAPRRVSETRLAKLARYTSSDQASWFATALADAMGSSYALAERIMMDLSGRQLATALVALGAPATTTRAALESFFPHLKEPSPRHTLATELIASLDTDSCTARLDAWRRADHYTHGPATHVPALADTKPVRRETGDRIGRQDTRRGARKAG